MNQQQMVLEFHETFGIGGNLIPTIADANTRDLRITLIQEEFDEVKEALVEENLANIAKELADLLYVVYGAAIAYGIDMESVFQEVHRSNMSKVGGHRRDDGKWVKPATYSPACIDPIIKFQQAS
jgi:predicted HAD superfamily Cof-like phosphohydrolase